MRKLAAAVLAAALAACGSSSSSTGPRPMEAGAPDAGKLTDAAVDAAAKASPATTADAGVDDTAMPAASSEELTSRMRHLVEAIAQDNAELAADALLPRDAYMSAFDAQDPGKAWERKVGVPFRKNVHALHKRLKGAEKAKFVSFEIGRSIVQATPKKHDLKRPLWRVKRSRLTLSIDGREHKVDIGEMISWRGAWYVAKLH